MKAFVLRCLCFIGIHKWKPVYWVAFRGGNAFGYRCKRCKVWDSSRMVFIPDGFGDEEDQGDRG